MRDSITITLILFLVIFTLTQLIEHITPMFQAYLQYRLEVKGMQMSVEKDYDVRLQRENDESDTLSEIRESDERASIHDEKLSL